MPGMPRGGFISALPGAILGALSARKVMKTSGRARSRDELIELINQALDAVEDLRAAIEYDEEYVDDNSIIVEPLSNGLADVLIAIRDGEYQPGQGGWFDFLEGIRDMDHRALPFWPLLRRIIDTHENGYRVDDPAAD